MYFSEIADKLQELVDNIVAECEEVRAEHLGLDKRCGLLLVGKDFVASCTPSTLDYYGGFEYVDHDDTIQIFDVKIYSADDERVAEAIVNYRKLQK